MKYFNSKKHLLIAILPTSIFISIALTFFILYKYEDSKKVLSENATIDASIVKISTEVPGEIVSLYVKEGDIVSKGQKLFTVDPEFYQLRLEQVKAQVKIAETTLNHKLNLIKAENHNALITNEQIERATTNLNFAIQSKNRMEKLALQGYVTQQQLEDVTNLVNEAQVSLKQAYEQAQAAKLIIGNPDSEIASLETAKTELKIAERNLKKTSIFSPLSGYILGINAEVGEHILPDLNQLSIIDTSDWHAIAFFKETELKKIHIGQCAKVFILADTSLPLKGKVINIGKGVSTDEIINLPNAVPYVRKNMNWIRVSQRFPIKIKLFDINKNNEWLLRVGASATAIIHNENDCLE